MLTPQYRYLKYKYYFHYCYDDDCDDETDDDDDYYYYYERYHLWWCMFDFYKAMFRCWSSSGDEMTTGIIVFVVMLTILLGRATNA